MNFCNMLLCNLKIYPDRFDVLCFLCGGVIFFGVHSRSNYFRFSFDLSKLLQTSVALLEVFQDYYVQRLD